MVDAMVTLRTLGWQWKIIAISRNGTLPQSHFRGIAYPAYPHYLGEHEGEINLNVLLRLVSENCESLRRMSQNPSIAIDKLRPHTQQLWQSLSDRRKRIFITESAPRWNVMRHRIAVQVHEQLTDSIDTGQLAIVSGSIKHLDGKEDETAVQVNTGEEQTQVYQGDLVINCTGPDSHFSTCDSTLYQTLIQRGLVICDPLDMGLVADEEFAVNKVDAEPHDRIYAIGPVLKDLLWETTAVPELRVQASQLASSILNRDVVEMQSNDVLEYYIEGCKGCMSAEIFGS